MSRRKESTLVDGIIHWRCGTCKNAFPADGYYGDKNTANGLKSQCKKCNNEGSVRTRDKINARRLTRESQRRTRKSDPEKIRKREREYKRKRPQGKKHKVRRKLDWAVESGRMIRPEKCGECGGGGRIEAHHRDYDLPYEVEWLCTGCHGRRHWKENQHHLQETS